MFPGNNVWNTPIDQLPVHANSSAIVNTLGAAKALHPDFGTAYGIPYVVVPGSQPKVPIAFTYADESDPSPYPVPANAPIEGGASSSGDRHVLVVENTNCVLYELYAAYPQSDGSWRAGSGAKFDLKSNALRPAGWTSADAAGLPILPGLIRYDEVASGEIRHAIRMTAPQTLKSYVWPARHAASSLTGSQYPPLGARFRLKASFDISPYPADVQVILRALKKYGALLADNGSSWYLTGTLDSHWNDDTLHKLGQVLGSNFEVVDESSLMVDPDSGATSTVLSLSGVQTDPAQVVLSAPAPAGGASVSLSSSNPAVASVPASVLVPAGANSAPFAITKTAVSAATMVTISAFYLGVTKTATLTVLPPALASLAVSPATVTGGSPATGSVQLNGPAPSGGVTVTLKSSDTTVATTPASVTVPAGGTAASFTVTTQPVTSAKAVTVSAVSGAVTCNASLTVNPPVASAYTVQAPSTGNRQQTITVRWTAPAGHSVSDFVGVYLANGTLYWWHTNGAATSGSYSIRLPGTAQVCRIRYVRADRTVAAETSITVR
jgi:hypothetical protein